MTRIAGKSGSKRRGFVLEPLREGADHYGLHLSETGSAGRSTAGLDLRVNASRARRVLGSALSALKASGHSKTALGLHRPSPLVLTEEAGVRLAIVLLTTAPLLKSRRVEAIAGEVDSMATEEAYYWYAKCVGPDASRARRALRLLLALE